MWVLLWKLKKTQWCALHSLDQGPVTKEHHKLVIFKGDKLNTRRWASVGPSLVANSCIQATVYFSFVVWAMQFLSFFFLLKIFIYLFIYLERMSRVKGRGRGISRFLHWAGSRTWGLILGPRDHDLSWSQLLHNRVTQVPWKNLFFELLLDEVRCLVLPTAVLKGVLITTHISLCPLISLLHQGLPGNAQVGGFKHLYMMKWDDLQA